MSTLHCQIFQKKQLSDKRFETQWLYSTCSPNLLVKLAYFANVLAYFLYVYICYITVFDTGFFKLIKIAINFVYDI